MHLPPVLTGYNAEMALVLGSGLSSFVERLEVDDIVEFTRIEGLPQASVPGHEGRFVCARVGGRRLLVAQGRVHYYEGWSAADVAMFIDMFHALGIRAVVLTNAAGIVNPAFVPGTWMMISDHLNLTGQSPLRGGASFVDLSDAYSPRLRDVFRSTAAQLGVPLPEGVYAAMPGPQYETPAEIRMLRTLGADAVGMSTVLEVIRARYHGMEVAAFSCLTNFGAGLTASGLSHAEVTEVGRKSAGVFADILSSALPRV